MRIIVDLDGTICSLKKRGQDYSEVKPNYKVVEKLKRLKKDGHYIIIQTARHMKSTGGNIGLIHTKVGKKTLDWLNKYSIPHDEIFFGKPNGDVYIDDLAKKFDSWDSINSEEFNEKRINVLIPIAGEGSRFKKAGFNLPKPLIDVNGKPMLSWALKTFENLSNYDLNFIFVVLKEHLNKYKLDKKIYNLLNNTNHQIVIINKPTRGQAETCLMAKKYINNMNKLIIYNGDTYSVTACPDLIDDDVEGIIPCFDSDNKRYSYVKLDEFGYVSEVVEKRVISNHATTGLYYFKWGRDFISAAEKMIENNEMEKGEFYVGPTYNYLIKNGKRIKICSTIEKWVLGTPEELNCFIKNYNK